MAISCQAMAATMIYLTKFCHFLFFLFLLSGLKAQEPEVRWSKAFPYSNKRLPLQILHAEGEEVYLLRGRLSGPLKEYQIEVFDRNTLAKLRSIKLSELFPQSANLSFYKASVQGGAVYFFLRRDRYIYCSKYHFASKRASHDAQMLSFLSKKGESILSGDAHLHLFFSENAAYLVAYQHLSNDKNEQKKIRYTLLDTSLKQVDQRVLSLPYKDKHYQETQYWVNAQGDLSILGFKEMKDRNTYLPLLNRYIRAEDKTEEVNFPLPQGYLLNSHFSQEQDVLSYQGLFLSHKHVFFYLFRFQETQFKLLSTFYLDLSNPDLALRYPSVYQDLDLKHFQLLQVKQHNDTLLVLLEKQTHQTESPKGYLFEDLLMMKVSPKGHVLWMSKIPKKQFLLESSPGAGYQSPEYQAMTKGLTSASLLQTKEAVYLLYNDHKRNTETDKAKEPQTLRFKLDARMCITRLDSTGNWNRKIMYDAPSERYYLSHTHHYTTSNNEHFFLAISSKKNEAKLVRVEGKSE